MEAFTAAVELLQKIVIAIGVGCAIVGGLTLASAQAENNPGEKLKGVNLFIAAGICGLVGAVLVPILLTVLS